MNIKKIYIYLLTAMFIFQDTLGKLLTIKAISYIDEILVIILIIISAINIIRNRKVNKLSFKIFILLVLFSFIGIYSTYLNSEFIFKNVLVSNFLSIKFIIVIVSLINMKLKKSTIDYIINSILFYSKIIGIFAIFNLVIPNLYVKIFPFISLTYRFGLPAVCSLFTHPGTYGWFMLLIALYYYSGYVISNDNIDFKMFVIYALLSILSSRVKVIISIVGILIYVLFKKKKFNIKHIIISFSIIFIVLIFCYDLLLYTYFQYFTNELGESSRRILTLNSLEIVRDYFPIGVGFGKFASWYARINYSEHYYAYNMTHVYGMNPDNAFFATDTYWPSILGETGFLGTVIFIVIFYFIYKGVNDKYKLQESEKRIVLFSMFVLIQSIIESTSEAIYNNAPQFIFVSCILGVTLSDNAKWIKEDIK